MSFVRRPGASGGWGAARTPLPQPGRRASVGGAPGDSRHGATGAHMRHRRTIFSSSADLGSLHWGAPGDGLAGPPASGSASWVAAAAAVQAAGLGVQDRIAVRPAARTDACALSASSLLDAAVVALTEPGWPLAPPRPSCSPAGKSIRVIAECALYTLVRAPAVGTHHSDRWHPAQAGQIMLQSFYEEHDEAEVAAGAAEDTARRDRDGDRHRRLQRYSHQQHLSSGSSGYAAGNSGSAGHSPPQGQALQHPPAQHTARQLRPMPWGRSGGHGSAGSTGSAGERCGGSSGYSGSAGGRPELSSSGASGRAPAHAWPPPPPPLQAGGEAPHALEPPDSTRLPGLMRHPSLMEPPSLLEESGGMEAPSLADLPPTHPLPQEQPPLWPASDRAAPTKFAGESGRYRGVKSPASAATDQARSSEMAFLGGSAAHSASASATTS